MSMTPETETGALSIANMHETGLNVVEFFCGAVARPVELFTRLQHGTTYFDYSLVLASTAIMVIIPALLTLVTSAASLIPFSHPSPPPGLFGFGSFTEVYFLASFLHGIRLYRRMIHMHTEEFSFYEGEPLPFFKWIPWCKSTWITRIVAEPLFVLLVAIVLHDLFIIQSSLATYLEFAALALALKNFVAWFRCWQTIRKILDAKNPGPILARLAENRASDEELASINLASFQRTCHPPSVRKQLHPLPAHIPQPNSTQPA